MKDNIHPKLLEASVHCACGNTFTTLSTKANLSVEICSNCHPLYTGQQRNLDTGGQVGRFMRRWKRDSAEGAAPTDGVEAVPAGAGKS